MKFENAHMNFTHALFENIICDEPLGGRLGWHTDGFGTQEAGSERLTWRSGQEKCRVVSEKNACEIDYCHMIPDDNTWIVSWRFITGRRTISKLRFRGDTEKAEEEIMRLYLKYL